jgi:DNA-binding IclR family transcriptional regulator
MSLLVAILETLQQAEYPLSLNDLSRHLNVEPSALQGMLDLLVHRGRLRVLGPLDGTQCATLGCWGCSASGPARCPLVFNEPTRYEVIPR